MKGAQCDETFASIHLSKVSPIKRLTRDVVIALSLLALIVFNYLEKTAALVLYGLACIHMRSCSCTGIHRKPTANQYCYQPVVVTIRLLLPRGCCYQPGVVNKGWDKGVRETTFHTLAPKGGVIS